MKRKLIVCARGQTFHEPKTWAAARGAGAPRSQRDDPGNGATAGAGIGSGAPASKLRAH